MQRSDWSASLLFLMSLAGQATSPLGKSCGVESMGTGGRGEDIAFEDTALLKLAFFLLFLT